MLAFTCAGTLQKYVFGTHLVSPDVALSGMSISELTMVLGSFVISLQLLFQLLARGLSEMDDTFASSHTC